MSIETSVFFQGPSLPDGGAGDADQKLRYRGRLAEPMGRTDDRVRTMKGCISVEMVLKPKMSDQRGQRLQPA